MTNFDRIKNIKTNFEIDDIKIKIYNIFNKDETRWDAYGLSTGNIIELSTKTETFVLVFDLYDYDDIRKVWRKNIYDMRKNIDNYDKPDFNSIRKLFNGAKEKCPGLQKSLKELSEYKKEYVKITKYAYAGYALKILQRYGMFSANKSNLEYFIKDFANNENYIFLKENSTGEFSRSSKETYCSEFLKGLFNNKNNSRTEILELLNYRKLDDESHNLILKGLESINKDFEDRDYMRQFTPGTIKLYCHAPNPVKLFIQEKFFTEYNHTGHFYYEIENIERKEKSPKRINFFGNKNKTSIDIKIPYYVMEQGIIKRDYIDISDKVEFVKEDDYNRIELKVLEDIEYDEIGIRTHYHAGSSLTVSKIPCEDRYTVRFANQFKYFEDVYGKTADYYSILNHYLNDLIKKYPLVSKIDAAMRIEDGVEKTAIKCCLTDLTNFKEKNLDDIKEYIDEPVKEMIDALADKYFWKDKSFALKKEIDKEVEKIQDKIYSDLVKKKDTSYPSMTYYNLLISDSEKYKLNSKALNLAVEKILNEKSEARDKLIEYLGEIRNFHASEILDSINDKNYQIIKNELETYENHIR